MGSDDFRLVSKYFIFLIIMFFRNSRGFTLIEILVAIAIFAILSSIMLLNFRGDAKTKELKNNCQQVVDALKQVQTMALSGQQVKNNAGILMVPDGYKFMPACLNNSCRSIYLAASSSPTANLGIIKLNKSEIYGFSSLMINFLPPSADSQIWINGSQTSTAKMKIRHIEDNTLSRCVIYNSISGRMDVLSIDKCN